MSYEFLPHYSMMYEWLQPSFEKLVKKSDEIYIRIMHQVVSSVASSNKKCFGKT